jgi:hypothetical protein
MRHLTEADPMALEALADFLEQHVKAPTFSPEDIADDAKRIRHAYEQGRWSVVGELKLARAKWKVDGQPFVRAMPMSFNGATQ